MIADYIRRHHLGLIAIFIALTGTAVAAQSGPSDHESAVASKAGKRGPRGPQGPPGPQGAPGQDGSPDSAAQVLGKLVTVDGSGSNLDADRLDGLSSSDIGLGFFTGRVNNLVSGGTKGSPPSGLSVANSDPDLADEDLTLGPSRTMVMRGLSVVLTQPVGCAGTCGTGDFVKISVDAFVLPALTLTTSISCNIEAGELGCTAAGPSGVVPANSALRLTVITVADVSIPAGTDAMFSWRASAN